MTPHRADEEDDSRDLIRAERPIVAGPEALARIIDQSNREAAANRAQARELIRALEGVQRSQEYLGEALRDERRKSRWLLALLVVAPIVAAAGAWVVWGHVDALRTDVGSRIDRLAEDQQASRAKDAAAQREARAAELAGDIESLRRDLEASRDALASERKQVVDREAALAAAQSRGEAARGEIGAFEFELKSAKAGARAESARAAHLEKQIEDLKAELDANAGAPAPTTSAPIVADAPVASNAAPTPAAEPHAPPAETLEASIPAASSADVEKVRAVLNALLMDAGDAVRYEFRAVGGMKGRSLLDVVVIGGDDRGDVVRTIQAGRAEIAVDKETSSVVIRFFDGKLLVGTKQAPFFDGSYGLVVRGDPAKWRAAAGSLLK